MNNGVLVNYQTSLRQRRDLEVKLQHAREDLKARQIAMTPTGSAWKELGTSEDDRKTALAKALAEDTVCKIVIDQIRRFEVQLAAVSADIDAVEAERRDQEWQVTKLLAEALQGYHAHQNPGMEAGTTLALDAAREAAAAPYWYGMDDTTASPQTEAQSAAISTVDIPF